MPVPVIPEGRYQARGSVPPPRPAQARSRLEASSRASTRRPCPHSLRQCAFVRGAGATRQEGGRGAEGVVWLEARALVAGPHFETQGQRRDAVLSLRGGAPQFRLVHPRPCGEPQPDFHARPGRRLRHRARRNLRRAAAHKCDGEKRGQACGERHAAARWPNEHDADTPLPPLLPTLWSLDRGHCPSRERSVWSGAPAILIKLEAALPSSRASSRSEAQGHGRLGQVRRHLTGVSRGQAARLLRTRVR